MPRDLSREAPSKDPPPEDQEPELERDSSNDGLEDESILASIMSQQNEKRDALHPYVQTLSLSDVESCVRLEEETFPPQERCTREKVSCAAISLKHFGRMTQKT